jgi:hypothetical protein
MKLSDANLAPEKKYAHNRLQAEMEAFLRTKDDESASQSTTLREARLINVVAAATSSSPVEVDAEPLLPIAAAKRKRERDHDGRTDEIQLDWIKVSGPDASVDVSAGERTSDAGTRREQQTRSPFNKK